MVGRIQCISSGDYHKMPALVFVESDILELECRDVRSNFRLKMSDL
jgi:hypothetical protein